MKKRERPTYPKVEDVKRIDLVARVPHRRPRRQMHGLPRVQAEVLGIGRKVGGWMSKEDKPRYGAMRGECIPSPTHPPTPPTH